LSVADKNPASKIEHPSPLELKNIVNASTVLTCTPCLGGSQNGNKEYSLDTLQAENDNIPD
jgi:hypothetical protein